MERIINHEQAYHDYLKQNDVSQKVQRQRKALVVAVESFRARCSSLAAELELPHEDAESRVMADFAKHLHDYLQEHGNARFEEQCLELVAHGSACRPAFESDTNHVCLRLDGDSWMSTFYRSQATASFSPRMFMSQFLVSPSTLSVACANNFWANVAALVRMHGVLDYDFAHDTRRKATKCPIFWGHVEEGVLLARPSFHSYDMKVLCMDQAKLKLLPISAPDGEIKEGDVYYVVDFHCNNDGIVTHVNIWFQGPRLLYGQGYYNMLCGTSTYYNTLSLVNCVELAEFRVHSHQNPIVCYLTH